VTATAIPQLSGALALILVWLAAWIDLRTRRIPNLITIPGALLGLAVSPFAGGLDGLQTALAGLAVGMAVMLPGYWLRSTGAGDVKLMGAVGALVGPWLVAVTFVVAALTGAAIGVAYATAAWWTKGAGSPFRRYGRMLRFLLRTGRFSYLPPGPDEMLGQRFAFALPIAVGTSVAVLWPAGQTA
jgi:prepilin peptidase CpaA